MTDKERIRKHIEKTYKPYEVFEKWHVMEHFESFFGTDKIAQPTTERRMRDLKNEGFLDHPSKDLIMKDVADKYYYVPQEASPQCLP